MAGKDTKTKAKDPKGASSKDEKKKKKDKGSKYTDPELREKLKKKLKAGDKGGRKGQWSARKAQLLVQQYEKKGGGYTRPKDDTQQHLTDWSEESWQTQEGDARARDGQTTKRYLPEKAWAELSPEEREATEAAKRDGSRQGEQHVANTPAAKKAGARARRSSGSAPLDGYDDMTVAEARRHLGDLDPSQLRQLAAYEERTKNRSTLLAAVRSRLDR